MQQGNTDPDRRQFLVASAMAGLTSVLTENEVIAESISKQHRQEEPLGQLVKVILPGGPSQIDLWAPKPDSEANIRGPFGTISTAVPGVHLSELLPEIAVNLNRFTIIRSITGSAGSHELTQCRTGSIDSDRRLPPSMVVPAKLMEEGLDVHSFEEVHQRLAAGAKEVTLIYGHWDHHRNLAGQLKPMAAKLDRDLCRFLIELEQTGQLQQTTVLVWGEFGRSPSMNRLAGRDHWPAVNSALITGGPCCRGNVVGATSNDGSYVVERPTTMMQVMSLCRTQPAAFAL